MSDRHQTAPASLKAEIRAFWNARAQATDRAPNLSPGHAFSGPAEHAAWLAVLARLLGPAHQGKVLELAPGTGELTAALLDLGADVTAIDLSEAMLNHARARFHLRPVHLKLGDAEQLDLPDQSFDAVICRDLVWTLAHPGRAFDEWHRVLRPRGRLVIIDGNWARLTLTAPLRLRLARAWQRLAGASPAVDDQVAQAEILSRLPFGHGLRTGHLMPLLALAGFGEIVLHDMTAVRRARRRGLRGVDWLRDGIHPRFVLSARKLGPPFLL